MENIMGKSWKTAIIGYSIIVLTWLQQIFGEQTVPQNSKEWLTFLVKNAGGLAAVLAKDWNVTNSPASISVTAHIIGDEASTKVDTTTTNVGTTPVTK